MGIFLAPETSIRHVLDEHNVRGGRMVLGISGGVDSVCLLHLLARLAPEYDLDLHIVHVHHRIRGEDADADAAFVHEEAERLGLPVVVRHVDVPRRARAARASLEETARQWRYAILGREAEALRARWIAVAHNADDQVETVLMHILRGAGLAGLRGMRPLTAFHHLRLPLVPPLERPQGRDLWLLRPLLYTLRQDIDAWVRKEGLTYRFDISNLDTTYFRNRLRHEIIPLLETVNPQVKQALFATAELAAADFDLLHPLAQDAWQRTWVGEGEGWVRFHLDRWRGLPLALRRAIIRDAVMYLRRELRDVGFLHVERARRFLEDPRSRTGSECTLPAGLVVRREYETFLITEKETSARAWDVPQVEGEILVPGEGVYVLGSGWWADVRILPAEALGSVWKENPDPWTAYFDADTVVWPLRFRARRPGDRMEPLGLPGKKPLVSEIMINRKVPRWTRERWPLLVDAEDRILWIVGVRQGEPGRITHQTSHILVVRILSGEEGAHE